MGLSADFRLERTDEGLTVRLFGDWTAVGLDRAGVRLDHALKRRAVTHFDLSELGRFDTAGAHALIGAAGASAEMSGIAVRSDVAHLLNLVWGLPPCPLETPPRRKMPALMWVLARIGRGVVHAGAQAFLNFAFYGRLLTALAKLILDPRRFRAAPTVDLMQRVGLDALPIIMVTNFFIGATIAFLGTDLLRQFGASVFTVELVGVGMLREFGVVIAGVILAGRSASSFAAEIGAMKMNQEVDAIQVLGVDPFEALVLPRFIAMVTMTPLLTFVAMIAGVIGGVAVIWTVADLTPSFFFERMLQNVGIRHFWVGIAKAPVFAIVIAAIGCRQGLEVGGDVEQLGRRVTAAVVQALFAIIVIDALFALLYMEMSV